MPSWTWKAYAGSLASGLLAIGCAWLGWYLWIVFALACFVFHSFAMGGAQGKVLVSNRPVKGRCANCKYDLSGLKAPPKCPECGTPIDWTPKS